MQLYPLQEPFKSTVVQNSSVPKELAMRIKEEFQKSKDMSALEDKYGVGIVKQVLGEKNDDKDEKKNSVKFKTGTKVSVDTGEGYYDHATVITGNDKNGRDEVEVKWQQGGTDWRNVQMLDPGWIK